MLNQKIIDLLYRYPKAKWKTYQHYGGIFAYRRMQLNSRKMKGAVASLPEIKSNPDGLPIYFLTGEKYLYQTLFCMASAIKYQPGSFRFILVDDGTFNREIISLINKQTKNTEIVSASQIKKNLDKLLPEKVFPVLHHKRRIYPHIKKLTDIHSIQDGNDWKLVLDSDMLFWQKASDIIHWLKSPQSPIYMQDCEQSYGYTTRLMEKLCGSKIHPLINVGVIGLKSSGINWRNLENWITGLEEAEKTSYYLEQALTSMIIGENRSVILNKDQYIVNPTPDQVTQKEGILHHYVDLSKIAYFAKAWKTF
ncbi:glycosyl transferase [Pedobacter ghigonis]|uniref:glycosyl transferase n=1 Tax=Pedobacter ghigonis TaxID=2730403 RepID=UPI00158BEBA6|nr:glycosyl transferase [Pedobacter ghigonis]